jgi:hypothetical protein
LFLLVKNVIGYSTTNKTATVMGQFLNAADLGASRAFASTGGSTGTNFGAGSIEVLSTTVVSSTPRRYFSFNPSAANRITYTTTVK